MIRIGYLQSTSTLQSGEQRFRVAPEFGLDGGIAGPVILACKGRVLEDIEDLTWTTSDPVHEPLLEDVIN